VFGRELQLIGDVNAPDDQDFAILFNLPLCLRKKPAFAGRDPARFQRAAEGARQSTGCGSHQVIEGGGMRLVHGHIRTVVGSDLVVNPKLDRFRLGRQVSAAVRAFHPFNTDS
jgi:hypothetical protein